MNNIRLILVDDNARYRASLTALLSQWPYVRIVAEADSGSQALELAEQLRPDLMLVDLVMPGINGIDLTRQIKRLSEPPHILVLTMHNMPSYQKAALEAGADDFLAKDQVTTSLAPAICRLFPGRSPEDYARPDGPAANLSPPGEMP